MVRVVIYSFAGYQVTWVLQATSKRTLWLGRQQQNYQLPLTVPLCDMKRVIQHSIHNAWQESWNLQTTNKLHCVKPVIGAMPIMLMRRTDVKLTRLRIGHTRFTHRHLLLATRGLLATDNVILNHGQVTWTTPELAPPSHNYHTTPTGGRFSSRQIYRASLFYTADL
ncbi:RNase H domain-containing protein [Trichonephila clavipes]|nr:RNase H domain-containing protein [Trichonephila clavipes]